MNEKIAPTFIDRAQQAFLHQETYRAVLKGVVTWGNEKQFAIRSVGITPNYLSNLLNPDHAPPSPDVAYRIVNALPLDAEQRLSLLEHMLLARQYNAQVVEALRTSVSDHSVDEFHYELRKIFDAVPNHATLATIRNAGKAFLRRINPRQHPFVFAEVCLIVNSAQSFLNRFDDALYLAKWQT